MTDGGRDGGLRIGEVARRTGLTVRALHHYDRLGLLVPTGRSSGDHRRYGPDDLRRLLHIQHLRALGLSLAEVRSALDDPGFDANRVLDRHIERLHDQVELQRRLLDRLRVLRNGNEAAWPDLLDTIALTERLRHPEPTVRVRAALDGRSVPLPVLLHRLATEADPAVHEVLIWAVVQHGAAALQPLLALLDDAGTGVRQRAAQALGKLADPAAARPLATRLDDADPVVRTAAVTALGRIGDESTLPAVLAMLGGTDEPFAAAVTDALIAFGEPTAQRLAAHPPAAPAARRQAVEVLSHLDSPAAHAALVTLAADADLEVRRAAVFALAAVPGSAAEAAIGRAATSGDARLRQLAERISSDRQG